MRLTDGLRTRLRAWLLTEHRALIDGQRRDFDQLGQVLAVKDAEAQGLSAQVDAINRAAGAMFHNLDTRLRAYERNVPAIARVKKALDEKAKREHARRERLVLEHPELSEEGKAHVRATGLVPEVAKAPPLPDLRHAFHGLAMSDDQMAARRLELVREAEADGDSA